MTDQTETVLNHIDAALNTCVCGDPIPENGPSPDYCNETCQYEYTAAIVGAEPDPELTYPLPPAETNGHTINDEANAWIAATGEAPVECPPDSLGADLQRLSEFAQAMAHAFPGPFNQLTNAIAAGLERAENMRTLEVVVPDPGERTAYLDACDNDPSIAIEYAQVGIPPAMIPDLRANGVTAVQAAISINTTDRSTL